MQGHCSASIRVHSVSVKEVKVVDACCKGL